MPTVEHARQQQREIEEYWRAGGQEFGALIGWLDWETEIRIMEGDRLREAYKLYDVR
jgi:hypothetical protein